MHPTRQIHKLKYSILKKFTKKKILLYGIKILEELILRTKIKLRLLDLGMEQKREPKSKQQITSRHPFIMLLTTVLSMGTSIRMCSMPLIKIEELTT